jgi:hypothetical protein
MREQNEENTVRKSTTKRLKMMKRRRDVGSVPQVHFSRESSE